jgi:hypothetical protein
LGEDGEQDGGEDRNNRDDDEKLDEREGGSIFHVFGLGLIGC